MPLKICLSKGFLYYFYFFIFFIYDWFFTFEKYSLSHINAFGGKVNFFT